MSTYSLCATFSSKNGGEWTAEYADEFPSLEKAGAEAKRWGRELARTNGDRFVDAYAVDSYGNASE